jgi:hypothetical protein
VIVISVAGFAPSIVDQSRRNAPMTLLVGAHGIVAASWLFLFLLQSFLVASLARTTGNGWNHRHACEPSSAFGRCHSRQAVAGSHPSRPGSPQYLANHAKSHRFRPKTSDRDSVPTCPISAFAIPITAQFAAQCREQVAPSSGAKPFHDCERRREDRIDRA